MDAGASPHHSVLVFEWLWMRGEGALSWGGMSNKVHSGRPMDQFPALIKCSLRESYCLIRARDALLESEEGFFPEPKGGL